MSTKLTLRLDDALIKDAKRYAAQEGRSVSELVAAYFMRLGSTVDDATLNKMPGKVPGNAPRKSSFYGLLGDCNISPQALDKKAYLEHLTRKHQ